MSRGAPRRLWIALAAVAIALLLVWMLQGPEEPAGPERAETGGAASDDSPPVLRTAVPAEEERSFGDGEPEPEQAPIPPFRFRVTTTGGEAVAGARLTRFEGERRIDCGATDPQGAVQFVVPRAGISAVSVLVSKAGFREVSARADRGKLNEVRLEEGVTVAGLVLERGTEAAIVGATVRAFTVQGRDAVGRPVMTDARGHFTLAGLPQGQALFLVARPEGLHAAAINRTFPSDDPVVLHVGGGGTLTGTVYGSDGTPAPDTLVWLVRPKRAVPPRDFPGAWVVNPALYEFFFPRVRTDEHGRYEIRGIELKQPRVAVAWFSERVEVAAEPITFTESGQRLGCDLRLPELGAIRYRVLDDAKKPLEGVQVDFNSERVWFTVREAEPGVEAEVDGWLRVQSLVPGRWTVRAWIPGSEAVEQTVVVEPGGQLDITLEPPHGEVLTGVVVDKDGKPVSGAELTWYDGTAHRGTRADPAGRFRMTAMPATAGRLMVRADWMGMGSSVPLAPETIEGVRAGGKPLRIVLHASGQVTGRVPGLEAGAPLKIDLFSKAVTGSGGHEVEEDGRFAFTAPRHGVPFLYRIERAGFAPIFLEHAALGRGEDLALGDLVFGHGSKLTGVVETSEGVPVAGATVRLVERWLDQSVETPKSGAFTFERLPARPIWVRVDARGFPPHFLIVPLRGSGANQRIVLSAGGRLVGDVIDAEGKAFSKGSFMVTWDVTSSLDADLDHLRLSYRLSKDGKVSLRLQPGTYRLRGSGSDPGQQVEQRVEIREGKTTDLRMRMPRR